jgi:hypothetical protein
MDEQIFYVTYDGQLPKAYTLTALKDFCRRYTNERWEFYRPFTIGTDWRNWPHAVE